MSEQKIPITLCSLQGDPKSKIEHLFDRGYQGLASRPVDDPWKVIVHSKRHYIGGDKEVWFYTDASSPSQSPDALHRAERVLSRFVLGHDVRGFIKNLTRKPKIGGKYLPQYLRPLDPRLVQIAIKDVS
ncbi:MULTISPECIES: hypothetical protein [Rhodobacterales]|uniref:hypothetical protein n=1 Tax=Rhodobacterales TaxID=204455 RepID=UPI0032971BD5